MPEKLTFNSEVFMVAPVVVGIALAGALGAIATGALLYRYCWRSNTALKRRNSDEALGVDRGGALSTSLETFMGTGTHDENPYKSKLVFRRTGANAPKNTGQEPIDLNATTDIDATILAKEQAEFRTRIAEEQAKKKGGCAIQ